MGSHAPYGIINETYFFRLPNILGYQFRLFPLQENVPWGLYGGYLEFRQNIHKRVVHILTFDPHVTERCVTPLFQVLWACQNVWKHYF